MPAIPARLTGWFGLTDEYRPFLDDSTLVRLPLLARSSAMMLYTEAPRV